MARIFSSVITPLTPGRGGWQPRPWTSPRAVPQGPRPRPLSRFRAVPQGPGPRPLSRFRAVPQGPVPPTPRQCPLPSPNRGFPSPMSPPKVSQGKRNPGISHQWLQSDTGYSIMRIPQTFRRHRNPIISQAPYGPQTDCLSRPGVPNGVFAYPKGPGRAAPWCRAFGRPQGWRA